VKHDAGEPAPFLLEVASGLPDRGRPVLDLACGRGRNARALARAGRFVIATDRDREALEIAAAGDTAAPIRAFCADLESGSGIPLESESCDGVLVFRFLVRELASEIERVLAPGGQLVYETFTVHQRELGYGPRNKAFLLEPGELETLFPGLRTLHSEEGLHEQPRAQATARLLAEKPT
jgi:SAM-dependent methyltransferase